MDKKRIGRILTALSKIRMSPAARWQVVAAVQQGKCYHYSGVNRWVICR